MSSQDFITLLEGFGLSLASKIGDNNTLNVDPLEFKQRLSRHFTSNPSSSSESVDDFISSLHEYLDEGDDGSIAQRFRTCLLPIQLLHSEADFNAMTMRESLFRYLLNIPCLQSEVQDVLLTKLSEIASDDIEGSCDIDTAKAIINQLRWLDQISEPRQAFEDLLDVVKVSPLPVKHEIINALPEIFIDVDHSDLLRKLRDLAKDNNDLFVPIIECLGNINIPSEDMESTYELVLSRLDSIDLDSLAIAVQFLISSATTKEAMVTAITSIRQKVDLDEFRASRGALKKKGNYYKQTVTGSYESLLVDRLEKILLSNSLIKESWIQVLMDLHNEDRVYPLDLVVLVLLHEMGDYKSKVSTTFQFLLKQGGKFNIDFIKECIRNYLPLIEKKTMELVTLSENMLRSKISLGGNIYCSIFVQADLYYRQEVVGALLTHIGSGNVWEVDPALQCLEEIAMADGEGLLRFVIFIKGVLDYLDQLSLAQIEQLFRVYTLLGVVDGSDGGLLNDLYMVIRKQLAHPLSKFKSIGITATLSMVGQLSKLHTTSLANMPGSSLSTSESNENSPLLKQAVSMLQLLQLACHTSHPSLAASYEKLAQLIITKELHRDFVNWIFDEIVTPFSDLFVIEMDKSSQIFPVQPPTWPKEFKLSMWGDLNGMPNSIAINILPTVTKHIYNPGKGYHPDLLCSMFRLYQSCEQFTNGSIENLDALLGCGVTQFDQSMLSSEVDLDSSDIQQCLIPSLIVGLNWYREVINAFYPEKEPTIQSKVKARLVNMLDMERLLFEHFDVKMHHILLSPSTADSAGNINLATLRQKLRKMDPLIFSLVDSLNIHEDLECVRFLLDTLLQQIIVEPNSINQSIVMPQLSKLYNKFLNHSRDTMSQNGDDDDNEITQCDDITLILDCLLKLVESHTAEPSSSLLLLLDLFLDMTKNNDHRILTISMAIQHQKLLSGIAKRISMEDGQRKQLYLITSDLINRSNWSSYRTKELVARLLKDLIIYAPQPVIELQSYINNILSPYCGDPDIDLSDRFPLFAPSYFSVYYQAISQATLDLMPILGHGEILEQMKSQVRRWQSLTSIACEIQLNSRPILLTALRHGSKFIDLFSKQSLPLLDTYLLHNRPTALQVFKSVQAGTRNLQRICNSIKTSSEKTLASLVPSCRAKMEGLIIKVKNMFVDHGLGDVYSVGDLKHRSLTGEVLPNQILPEEIFTPASSATPINNNGGCVSEEEQEPYASKPSTVLKKQPRRRGALNHDKIASNKKKRVNDQENTPILEE